MLQTIEVEIDANGQIRSLEPMRCLPTGRALLTLLAEPSNGTPMLDQEIDSLFGILKADRCATLQEMDAAVHMRAGKKFNDRA